MEREWRVGELARVTGLTVRTLHHYDEVGLLKPKGRTAAGSRVCFKHWTEAATRRRND